MTDNTFKRTYGVANYKATWIGKSLLVRLTASGILPCYNYTAQLEKRPERVEPPNWDMIFYTQDVCLKALKPFNVEVTIPNTTGATSILVYDALGEQYVPIEYDVEFAEPEASGPIECCADKDEYIVYARLPKPGSGHQGCIVVPADSVVIAIYYKAFGPAPKAECDAFVLKNCAAVAPLGGGDVPFPLVEG